MPLTFLGEVRMPSGKNVRPHITDNKDGTITIKYQPTERGLHEMDIKYDGNHIPGQKHTQLDSHDLFKHVLMSYMTEGLIIFYL